MGYSIDILNSIRTEGSADYQARIPVATQENISSIGNSFQTYTPLFNEFSTALINKIGKTIIEQKLFTNDLAEFKSGSILTQQDVEEIFIEMAKSEGSYDKDGKNPLGRRTNPDVKVMYHRQNRQDYYVISIGDIDFLRVFRSEATLDTFIAGLINSVYSGAEYDEFLAMKNILATYDGYFDYQVPEIVEGSAEAGAKGFLKTLHKAVYDLTTEPSTKYNASGVKTWSKKKGLVLYILKDVVTECNVEVLAKQFNLGKVEIPVKIKVLADFGTLENTYAILADRDFLKVWDTLSHMEPQRNAQGLFTNWFYHIHQILSASKFKNAVRFTTDEVTE